MSAPSSRFKNILEKSHGQTGLFITALFNPVVNNKLMGVVIDLTFNSGNRQEVERIQTASITNPTKRKRNPALDNMFSSSTETSASTPISPVSCKKHIILVALTHVEDNAEPNMQSGETIENSTVSRNKTRGRGRGRGRGRSVV